ncbi:MAG: ubiquinol-cytochrome c reductase iron-sulfur subunit [Pseudomonadota bacterium]
MATISADDETPTRRDFIHIWAAGAAAVGAGAVAWPFIDQMNPDASVLALASVEVDLSAVEVGQGIKVTWRGKPVFIRRRTAAEIEEAKAVEQGDLKDPQTDDERVIEGPNGALQSEWLVLVGICTHLGCVPLGTSDGESKGDYGGWFCPCHGSHYDTSGRIRKGPAPGNLEVPEYAFLSDTRIKIG